jgi:hypothetical protein
MFTSLIVIASCRTIEFCEIKDLSRVVVYVPFSTNNKSMFWVPLFSWFHVKTKLANSGFYLSLIHLFQTQSQVTNSQLFGGSLAWRWHSIDISNISLVHRDYDSSTVVNTHLNIPETTMPQLKPPMILNDTHAVFCSCMHCFVNICTQQISSH